MFLKCGKKVDIGRKLTFSSKVFIGNSSSIGDYIHSLGEVTIENYVMIAQHCTFIESNHISNNVWIGYGRTIPILYNVTIA